MMDGQWRANVPDSTAPPVSPVELPDGSYPTRLDDRGRLRLPAAFARYFERLAEPGLFVTSTDNVTVQIYPIAVWREKRLKLATDTQDSDAADVLLVAHHNGAHAQMDAQGRILVHEELRRKLQLENRPLRLVPWVWRVDVMTEEQYEERMAAAQKDLAAKVARVARRGML